MNKDVTDLDLTKAQRTLDEANTPEFSLADALNSARERIDSGKVGPAPSPVMDPATRPADLKGAMLWDRLQDAKDRRNKYKPAHPETPAEILARIAESARTDVCEPQPDPPAADPAVGIEQREREQRATDARTRFELEARLRRQMELDKLTMQQAEDRRERAQWEAENYWWKGVK